MIRQNENDSAYPYNSGSISILNGKTNVIRNRNQFNCIVFMVGFYESKMLDVEMVYYESAQIWNTHIHRHTDTHIMTAADHFAWSFSFFKHLFECSAKIVDCRHLISFSYAYFRLSNENLPELRQFANTIDEQISKWMDKMTFSVGIKFRWNQI